MAQSEVSLIEVKEDQGQQKDHEKRGAEQDQDEEKVWLLRGYLLNFHTM